MGELHLFLVTDALSCLHRPLRACGGCSRSTTQALRRSTTQALHSLAVWRLCPLDDSCARMAMRSSNWPLPPLPLRDELLPLVVLEPTKQAFHRATVLLLVLLVLLASLASLALVPILPVH